MVDAVILTYRYRLLPTRGQHRRLADALEHSRQLYNAALQERIDCYRKTGKSLGYIDQCRSLTALRADGTPYASTMQRATLKALDQAFKSFFARGGFPRFKGRGWYKSVAWSDSSGWRVRQARLFAKGIGAMRLHLHRPLPTKPLTCSIKREGRHWYACFTVRVPCAGENNSDAVGLDAGISTLAALSTGELISNPHHNRKAERETRRRARALARCIKGSQRRRKVRERLASWRATERRARDTYLHQVSAAVTRRFGIIAVENLNVRGLARGILARDVYDASWGKLISILAYKAERAGGQLVKVDPRHTSQTCPECGSIKPKTLAERVHSCPCGCEMDRDVAAAKMILLRAAVSGREVPNVAGCGVRAPGKAVA